jgi:hypothetical protein
MALETEPIVRRRRFTIEEYHRMGEAGILARRERVELIEGEIVEMTPIGRDHASVVDRLNMLFVSRFGDRAIVRIQGPMILRVLESEPEPDLILMRPKPDFYRSGHPEPADIFLVIEVMGSSAGYDRQIKLPLYARAGIPEVWLIDVNANTTEVCRDLTPGGYNDRRSVAHDGVIAPAAFPDVSFRGRDLTG